MTPKSSQLICILFLIGLLLGPFSAGAAAIDALFTFDDDIPTLPPATGGLNQPSSLLASPGTTVSVESTANGIFTQPVVLSVSAPSQFADVRFQFSPVSSGVIRVEATVAFDRLIDGFFFQTSVSPDGAVITRLIATSTGAIADFFGTILGSYAPNQPFNVRIDVDMSARRWSVTIDNELDGFADDGVIADLPFVNPDAVIPSFGTVHASFNVFPVVVTGASVAYDDIRVVSLAFSVPIDIRPRGPHNRIHPHSHGLIRVAILSTADFDAATVDPSSVRFGPDGASPSHGKAHVKDVNGDGVDDLVLRFRTRDTGIRCGDGSASLTASTFAGQLIQGTDSIRTTGCR